MHLTHNKNAVSHTIAALMLIVVAMGVAFVTYLFVMNYVGLSTTKSGKAIEIQNMNMNGGSLTVYVQNVGQETVTFDPANCIYANGQLKPATITKTTLSPGDTLTITVTPITSEPKGTTVKVATTDGTTTEATLQ
jgi:archaellum component FlaF (FlaF/FlaG flagellin family)